MDWTAGIDGYCERLAPGLWAEPLNLVTNAAFLIAALVMWRRCEGRPTGQALAAVLFVIGVGSGLFHSVATAWASLADVLPILGFILLYIYAANRDFIGLRPVAALAATAVAMLAVVLAGHEIGRILPGAGANAAYGAVAALILGYGGALLSFAPATGMRLLAGAAVLTLSITFRALDLPLCARWPTGTHFLWHLLNALMLAWMIEAWRLHRPDAAPS
jgi:hypothetical protein